MGTVARDTRTKTPSWRVQYTQPDGTRTGKGGFRTKREAEGYLATVEVSKLQGAYIAPGDARVTVQTLGNDWIATHKANVKPSTFHSDESAWRIHVEPQWGERSVGSIRHTEVADWIAKLGTVKSPTTVKRVHGVLAAILDRAVRDKRIPVNPARDVKTPKKVSKPRAYLTVAQVEQLSRASKYPTLILFLAYTGLRWGEATALRVKHIDQQRRRIEVIENAANVGGTIKLGTPKTPRKHAVPYPEFLAEAISAACAGKGADDLVFPSERGSHLMPGNAASGWFTGAVKRAQTKDASFPRLTPHDLRHTAASLAIRAGANVKALQTMLGHASAAMTLDRYADLFGDDLDAVAEALGRLRAADLSDSI